ncbi:BspA family leucine-rich repeat surface protein [Bifidobacterium sp. ESL0682]|uniref:BspA family leucine-rich repeat surface protein n=1 Tax=Bifidobacterium sp. ESL0682 TaxID=2983212 RepID=UPI0023F75622|nr:BspA family leucine-rich repeat surface protein [Bifidobacterium sp. ESL0682]WEV41952.1 BspA family leucine-rich repeat surface protein [Bifidobacterium sp. ESL0682]
MRGSCTAKTGTWGTATWNFTADCTLTIHTGDTQTVTSATTFGTGTGYNSPATAGSIAATATTIIIDGNLTVSPTSSVPSGIFHHWASLQHFRMAPGSTFTPVGGAGYGVFWQDTNLESVDTTGWDTSQTTDMIGMFAFCSKLASLDVTHFNTSKVAKMSQMFYQCSNLTSLDVSHFDTSHCTEIMTMFAYCTKLASIDVSNFDLTNVRKGDANAIANGLGGKITGMFMGDTNLTMLDLRTWNTDARLELNALLPDGLRMLALGPNTKLHQNTYNFISQNAFSMVNQGITWMQVSSFDPNTATVIGTVGTTPTLATRAVTNPGGFYMERSTTGLNLVVDANGGTGSYSQEYNTATMGQSVDAPAANKLTGNKPAAVFTGWNTKRDGTGTHYAAGQHIATLAKGQYVPEQTLTLYAQWSDVTTPTTLSIAYRHTTNTVVATSPTPVRVCISAVSCQTSVANGSSWTVSYSPAAFTSQFPVGTAYSLTASGYAVDPVTGTTVSSKTPATFTGTLPWMTVTLDVGDTHASGTVPTVSPALVGSDDGKADINLPKLASTDSNGPFYLHHFPAGWNHLTGQTTPQYATPGLTAIPTSDGTTTGGHTAVTLYLVWNNIATPLISAGKTRRSAATNQITTEGDAAPWTGSDILKVCIKPTGSTIAPTCQNATWTPTSAAWDGTTRHGWTVTFPRSATLDKPGKYDITATDTTGDTVWRDPAGTATSWTGRFSSGVYISGLALTAMPLTGGKPQHTAAALASGLAAALILLAAVTALRNRRRQARHSR